MLNSQHSNEFSKCSSCKVIDYKKAKLAALESVTTSLINVFLRSAIDKSVYFEIPSAVFDFTEMTGEMSVRETCVMDDLNIISKSRLRRATSKIKRAMRGENFLRTASSASVSRYLDFNYKMPTLFYGLRGNRSVCRVCMMKTLNTRSSHRTSRKLNRLVAAVRAPNIIV